MIDINKKPINERVGVSTDNVEQDLYGLAKAIPKKTIMGVGVLGAIGFSKIKRAIKYNKAKKNVKIYGEDFVSEIENWHELNDSKFNNICANSVKNYKQQIKQLEERYKQLEKYYINNPKSSVDSDGNVVNQTYVQPSPEEKKAQIDNLVKAISSKLKIAFDEYNKGLNAWSKGLLKNYTEDLFSNLGDNNLTKKYMALKQANALNKLGENTSESFVAEASISDAITKNYVTALSKKQIKELEGLWLKEIMRVNAQASDITESKINSINAKNFKGSDSGIKTLSNILTFDGPKGFMTTETLSEIKSYIDEMSSSLKYVDKNLLQTIAPKEPTSKNFEGVVQKFQSRINESSQRIKNKKIKYDKGF